MVWTDPEIARLRELVPEHTDREIADILQRPIYGVAKQRHRHGLIRPKDVGQCLGPAGQKPTPWIGDPLPPVEMAREHWEQWKRRWVGEDATDEDGNATRLAYGLPPVVVSRWVLA
jgi:hypothetical protein